MNKKKRLLRTSANILRVLPAMLLLAVVGGEKRRVIADDSLFWHKRNGYDAKYGPFPHPIVLMVIYPEFRNLVIHRIRYWGGGSAGPITRCCHYFVGWLIGVLFPPMKTLYLATKDIGRNLFIQHGFSTIVSARKIGDNCWINQQVTIGFGNSKVPPTLGNGVRVCAGAKVIGELSVGDNAIIGANAVVTKDVGSRDVVGGVPAKRIKSNDDHLLFP